MTNFRTLALALPLLAIPLAPSARSAPQWSLADNIFASDWLFGTQFGNDVAIDDDLLVIGAWGKPSGQFRGAAYVLRGSAGNFTEEAILTPEPAAGVAIFGRSVAVSGEVVLVGASSSQGGRCEAYVFESTGLQGGWERTALLQPTDLGPIDQFGFRVAVDQDRVVVGAPTQANSLGAAYVFVEQGGSWIQEAKLVASDGVAGDLFGIDVDIRGDRILVGACSRDEERGAVYSFERTGGNWSEAEVLTADGVPQPGDLFGISVSLDGERAAIGASQDGELGSNLGFAEVHVRSGSLWTFEARLEAFPLQSSTGYGNCVDLDGDHLVVSRGDANSATGDLLFFDRSSGSWTLVGLVPHPFPNLGEQFSGGLAIPAPGGASALLNGGLAIQDGFLAAGTRGDVVGGQGAAGRVYTFTLREETFGFCGANAECGFCPCGNIALTGPVLRGCENSDGRAARLRSLGDPSLAQDSLHFRVSGVTSESFGLLISGQNSLPQLASGGCGPATGVRPGNLDGLRCVGGGLVRHGTRPSDAIGDIGGSTSGWGPPDGPPGGLLAQASAVAGQTLYFQCFYRDDPALSCGTGQNTTNGVGVRIRP